MDLFRSLWYYAFSFAELRLNVLIETHQKSEDIIFWDKMQVITSLITSRLPERNSSSCLKLSSVFSWVRSSRWQLPIYVCLQYFLLPALTCPGLMHHLTSAHMQLWHLNSNILILTILCPFVSTIFPASVQRQHSPEMSWANQRKLLPLI